MEWRWGPRGQVKLLYSLDGHFGMFIDDVHRCSYGQQPHEGRGLQTGPYMDSSLNNIPLRNSKRAACNLYVI